MTLTLTYNLDLILDTNSNLSRLAGESCVEIRFQAIQFARELVNLSSISSVEGAAFIVMFGQ